MGAVDKTMPAAPDVLLVDTTGELKNFYAAADLIFVGKSLTSKGGQNIIEPAALGKPIVVGPHMSNFEAVMADFLAAEAVVQVQDATALESAVQALLGDRDRRERLGRNARLVVETKKGVARESVKALLNVLHGK
jgi:3-deoxy-D-manno-octulosonic-acid transferase